MVVLSWSICGRCDPSVDDDKALKLSSKHGFLTIVEMLLEDERIQPKTDSYALRWAGRYAHERVMKLLLEDGRIDPQTEVSFLIREASEFGNAAG